MKKTTQILLAGTICMNNNPWLVMRGMRCRMGIKQGIIAKRMKIGNTIVCDLERARRDDIRSSTVKRYVQALCGRNA